MYQKGMIKFGDVLDTSEEGNYENYEAAFLPHSCEKWVIGDVKRITLLINDLRAMRFELSKEEGK